jgi:nicotinate-nucleotide adenylyltransferase
MTPSTAGNPGTGGDRSNAGDRSIGRRAPWIEPTDLRVGILGGTFDPVHYGHLVIAEEVREALGLDRVLFVPAPRPPHKLDEEVAPIANRVAMVELAIAGNPAFAMSRVELDRSGPSYTVDTLETLANEARREGIIRSFFFILSSEAAATLPSWRAPSRILELARLVVVPRSGFPVPDVSVLASESGASPADERILTAETVPLAHSSSDVRARAASGRSIRYLVPPAVEAYIRDYRLYRSDNPRRTA